MDDYERRRTMSFKEAEGLELPVQLQPREVSQQLRSLVWEVVYSVLDRNFGLESSYIFGDGRNLSYRFFIQYKHGMADRFDTGIRWTTKSFRDVFVDGQPLDFLDATQWILRQPEIRREDRLAIEAAFVSARSAYRVVGGDTLVPIASPEEGETISKAMAALQSNGRLGARTHLQAAAAHLTAGRWADSVRESAQAIESAARSIEPSGELSRALAALETKKKIHGAMKKAFTALYGYTSDEQGIRHPLLDEGDAAVDEPDAVFMIGAAAAFISYLLSKGR